MSKPGGGEEKGFFFEDIALPGNGANRLKPVKLTHVFVLKVTNEYKVAKTENVDLDLFVVQYLSP